MCPSIRGASVTTASSSFIPKRMTVLVVKDRVLGHNPVAALYTSHSYYQRLTRGDTPPSP